MLFLGIVSHRVSTGIIKNIAIESTQRIIESVGREVNDILYEASSLSLAFSEDHFIQSGLRVRFDTIAERYAMDLRADSELHFISDYKQEIFGLYVIGENRTIFKSNARSVKDGDLRNSEWYRNIIGSDNPVWFPPHTGSFVVKTVGESLLSIGMPIIDKTTGKRVGVILADLAEEKIIGKLSNSLGAIGFLFLDYNEGLIIDAEEEDSVLQIISPGGELKDDDETRILIRRDLFIPGWEIRGLINVEELTGESRIIGLTLIIILLIVSGLYVLFAVLISGSVAQPVNKLKQLMHEAQEGNFSVYMDVEYNNELGDLGRSFNIMIGKINELVDNVNEEHIKLRKSELKALQAQINPHFLYNTLDSIIGLSMENRNEEVIKMVTALAKLFRIGISKGEDIIPISEEIKHVESYLTIQHTRYMNKFSFKIDVPESLNNYYTVKLILQPIVENAIYHGIKMVRGKGLIIVRAIEQDDCILFVVSDTGPGIPIGKLDVLNNLMDSSDSKEVNSYGLKNVEERLQIYFGKQFGLTFANRDDKGTDVTIRIPKITEEENYAKSNLS